MTKQDTELDSKSDNCVYIGKKETMSYVFAVQTQAQTQKEIRIKARGRSISMAVDVSQIALNRFLQGWELEIVNISTEEKQPKDPKTSDHVDRVSVIEIIIKKSESE